MSEYVFKGRKYTEQELLQKRAAYLDTMENIPKKAMREGRAMTEEERKDFDNLQKKFDAISLVLGDCSFAGMDFLKDMEEIKAKLDEPRNQPWRPGAPIAQSYRDLEPGEVIALSNKESLAQFVQARARYRGQDEEFLRMQDTASFGRIIRGMVTGDWGDAAPELRIMAQAGLGGAGWWTVPEYASARLIDLARNQAVCMRAGALTIPMEGPEVTITKIASDPVAYWRPENKPINESAMTFEPLKLKAVVLGILCRVSMEQMMDSPNFGNVVESAIAAALALEMDRAMLLGTGSGEPRGLVNTKGVQELDLGVNGAALANYDPFSLAAEFVMNANGTPNAVVYSPRTWGALDRLKEGGTNAPLKPPASYENLQKFATNQIPNNLTHGTANNASLAVVGDFTKLGLASLTGVMLAASGEAGADTFAKMQVLIRGFLRADVAVLRPNHFTKITGIIPA